MGPGAERATSSILRSEEPPEVVKFEKQARHYRPKSPGFQHSRGRGLASGRRTGRGGQLAWTVLNTNPAPGPP